MATPTPPTGEAAKRLGLGVLLIGLSVIGPIVAYAAITVVYPKSTHTVNVGGTPPITFQQGTDYSTAANLSLLSGLTFIDNNAAFTITVSTMAGSNLTIDKYVHAVKGAGVTAFKMSIGQAIGGTLNATEIAELKVRLWTGGTAPSTDYSAGVCAVLDLEAALATETTGSCTGSTVYLQLKYRLNHDAAGSSTVAIRPSSVQIG